MLSTLIAVRESPEMFLRCASLRAFITARPLAALACRATMLAGVTVLGLPLALRPSATACGSFMQRYCSSGCVRMSSPTKSARVLLDVIGVLLCIAGTTPEQPEVTRDADVIA